MFECVFVGTTNAVDAVRTNGYNVGVRLVVVAVADDHNSIDNTIVDVFARRLL